MLCFSLVGALIGIPIILGGLRLMVISVKGMAWGANPDAFFEGNCPHCGYEKLKSSEYADNPGINCPACAKRIVIRDKRFIKVD